MKKCPSGKKSYQSLSIAEDALVEAHVQFNYSKSQGPKGVYLCTDCGNYHLTSQGNLNDRLSKMMSDGSLTRLKEANQWMNKLKK
jgi:hypothetical protein